MSFTTKLRVLLVVAVAIAALGSSALMYGSFRSALEASEVAELGRETDLRAHMLRTRLDQVRSDVQFLLGTPPISGIERAHHNGGIDPQDGSTEAVWRERLATIFEHLAATRPEYLQIRFLDASGQELVRVERTPGDDELVWIDDANLQDKSGEPYVASALASQGTVDIGEVTLNREHGQVMQPPTPVLRAYSTTPAAESPFGLLVVNLSLEELVAPVIPTRETDHDVFLLDDRNLWLLHPDPARILTPATREELSRLRTTDQAAVASQPLPVGSWNAEVFVRDGQRRSALVARRAVSAVVSLLVVLVLLASALSVWASSHITRPLALLAEAVRRAEQEERPLEIPQGLSGEAGELAATFEHLARDLEARVEARTEALVEVNVALERASRVKDHFLATMSHELRTPLAGVLAAADSLLEGSMGSMRPSQQEMVQVIHDSGTHLTELITDILDISRLEHGEFSLTLEPLLAAEVCAAAAAVVRKQAQQAGLQLELDLAPEAMIRGDARRVRQILLNLLSNAVKFTPSGGRLGIRTRLTRDDTVLFEVWDEGIGIAADDLVRLFRPFSQLDEALKRGHEGTGLGLYLSRRLAEAQAGSLRVESAFGRGSTFRLELPTACEAELPASAAPTDEVDHPERPPLVLLVDDNVLNLRVLTQYLRRSGLRVQSATTGQEAIEMARREPPDALVLDVQMPGMDGLETLEHLRDDGLGAPVLVLTSLAFPEDRERCMEAGVDAFLSRPCPLPEVRRTLLRLARAA